MAVIYEVTVHVQAAVAAAYLAWLREHIAAMSGLPGFEDAELAEVDTGVSAETSWCIRYRLRDRGALEAYLREHAAQMRAEGLARFGDAFRAERRVLSPLEIRG